MLVTLCFTIIFALCLLVPFGIIVAHGFASFQAGVILPLDVRSEVSYAIVGIYFALLFYTKAVKSISTMLENSDKRTPNE